MFKNFLAHVLVTRCWGGGEKEGGRKKSDLFPESIRLSKRLVPVQNRKGGEGKEKKKR